MCALILASLSLGTPSTAQPAGTPPQWYLYHVAMNDTSGDLVRLRFDVTWGGPAAIYGARFAEGTFLSAGWAAFSGTGLHAGVSVGPHDATTDPVTGGGYARYGIVLEPVGVQQVVVLAVGESLSMDVLLEGEGTFELAAQGLAHYRRGYELEGGAFAGANVIDATARAAVQRSVTFDIEGYLFGWFLTPLGFPGESAGVASLRSEHSIDDCGLTKINEEPLTTRTKGCWFAEFDGPAARGPGRYRLDWTGANVQAHHTPLIAWADIPASLAPRPVIP